MKSELNRFLRYLQIEKGASDTTVEAYQLDIERGLIPFLHHRGKFEVREITKTDIRAYLDYVARTRGNCNATRARKLAALVPLAEFSSGALRIALELVFALFSPGCTLIRALFPRKSALGGIDRVALGFGLSIAVVPLIGLVLNYTLWGMRLYSILISVLVFIIVVAVMAWYRRWRLAPEQRFRLDIRPKLKSVTYSWAKSGRLGACLSLRADMAYKLRKEVDRGKAIGLSLSVPEVDAYLRFLKHRCRPNTWIRYVHDLQTFVNAVERPLVLVKPRDIFAFIKQQSETPSRDSGPHPAVPRQLLLPYR